MSHNYPFRRPPSDSDLRPEPGPRRPREACSSSYPSSYSLPPPPPPPPPPPSSRGSVALPSAQWSQDGVVSILSSCGLEPGDLALLAELPEDVLTVESLPLILRQIKSQKEALVAPSASSSSSSSVYPPRDREDLHQYQRVTPGPLSSEQVQNRRGSPRTSSSDFQHRPGPSEYGKTQDRPPFAPEARPSRFSEVRPAEYRPPPPPPPPPPRPPRPPPFKDHQPRRGESGPPSSSRTSQPSAPSEKQALDFHGSSPAAFPYSCSLCDMTVLSEKVWIQHVNGAQHADGQLSLLQQFPHWDCRMETVSRFTGQSEKWKGKGKAANQNQAAAAAAAVAQSNRTLQKKTSDRGKVVCVKFPAQSVDEAYLRKLSEPFGKIVKILMFPSLAFMELGSVDQAKDLVKFHVNYPPTVNGEQMEFSISNAFHFLQSSRVVSFTPSPTGEDGRSDLISIVKRFGPPLYTLFLPSVAFIEMTNVSDAQKLVEYYSTNSLKINRDSMKVSFSGEYSSLMGVSSAKKCDEEPSPTKKMRSLSPEKDQMTGTKRTRSGSQDSKTRSRSRDKFGREKRTRSRSRSRSRERKTRSRSRDEFGREKRTRSRSRDKSREKYSRDTRTRSRSREKSEEKSVTLTRTRTGENAVEPEKPDPVQSRSEEEPVPPQKPEAANEEQMEEMSELSSEDSDIEGMEVIAEDGENLEDEDVEEELHSPEERSVCPGKDGEEEVKEVKDGEEEVKDGGDGEEEVKDGEEPLRKEEVMEKETAETHLLEDEEEAEFPIDLENCITLDELEEDESDNQDEDVPDEPASPSESSRVIYFSNLPLRFYTDAEFLRVVKGLGTAVRYLLIRSRREGFIEMSSSDEAENVAKKLTCNPVTLSGCRLKSYLSRKYARLANGWPVELGDEKRSEYQSQNSRRSERRSKSRSSDQDEADRRSKGRKESSKKTSEKEATSRTTPEKEATSRTTPEKEATSRTTPEKEATSRTTPEKDVSVTSKDSRAATKNSQNKLKRKVTPDDNLVPQKTPKTENTPRKHTTDESAENEKSDTVEEEPAGDLLEKKQTNQPEDEKETFPDVPVEADSSEPTVKESQRPDPDSTGDPPKPASEQLSQAVVCSQDSEVDRQSGARGGAVGAEEPSKPVGAEFVRPVVGYFCNLCQLIFADEDEAKQQHCSSPTHYRRYQEKTGKDPWTS